MRAVRKIERKYYKYVDWSQPVLATNPQDGYSITATNISGDLKILSDGVRDNSYVTTTTTTSYGSIISYNFPINLKVSKVGFNYYAKEYVTWDFSSFKLVCITNEGEQTIADSITTTVKGWNYKEFNIDNIICKGIKIYCSGGGSPHPRIGEITITGQQIIEATESSYDYYIDIPTYKLPKINNVYYGINQ